MPRRLTRNRKKSNAQKQRQATVVDDEYHAEESEAAKAGRAGFRAKQARMKAKKAVQAKMGKVHGMSGRSTGGDFGASVGVREEPEMPVHELLGIPFTAKARLARQQKKGARIKTRTDLATAKLSNIQARDKLKAAKAKLRDARAARNVTAEYQPED